MSYFDTSDRVITATGDETEAEMLQITLAAAIVEIGAQTTWCVYTKPFAVGRTRQYAVCVRRVFGPV